MSKRCCLYCGIGIIVGVGVLSLFVWLIASQTHSPKWSLEKFYVPALDKSLLSSKTGATGNTTISFDLRFKNENHDGSSVNYDNINVGLYYIQKGNGSRNLEMLLPIGNVSIPRFYHFKVAHRLETVQTFGVPWEEARMELSNGSTRNMFQVDMVLSYRFVVTDFNRDTVRLVVNVSVNDQGMKTVPGSLRFT